MASPGHKRNILGDYNYVGIGTDTRGGSLYVTVVFVGRDDSTADSPPDASATRTPKHNGTFADDDGNIHEENIEAIAAKGITLGCNPPDNSRYCPDDSVTRGAMAAFIARAMGLPAVRRRPFQRRSRVDVRECDQPGCRDGHHTGLQPAREHQVLSKPHDDSRRDGGVSRPCLRSPCLHDRLLR